MQRFFVDTEFLRRSADEISSIRGDLVSINDEVTHVKNNLYLSIGENEQLISALDKAANNIKERDTNFQSMEQALLQIAECYEKTESRVISSSENIIMDITPKPVKTEDTEDNPVLIFMKAIMGLAGGSFLKYTGDSLGFMLSFITTVVEGADNPSEAISKLLSLMKSGGSMEKALYEYLYKHVPDFKKSIEAAVKTGGSKMEKVFSAIPVVNVFVSALSTAFSDYGRLSADGSMDIMDWSELAIDSSVDGLISVVTSLGGSPGAVAGVVMDITNYGEEIKQSIKDFGINTGNEAGAYIINNKSLKNLYDQGGIQRFISITYASTVILMEKAVESGMVEESVKLMLNINNPTYIPTKFIEHEISKYTVDK